MTNKKIKRFSQTRFIVLGFIIIILIGTLLLMTPLASKDNSMTSFMDCIFTAVSTTCVTGLAAVDTYSHWSFFGQVIILCLIQIGGLGFITIGVFFSVLLRRRIGLKTRGMMQESVNTLQIGGVVKLTKKIIKGTFIIEGIAALILGIRFSFDFGFVKGMWYGIFHSISAFCNAGFDLMGIYEPYTSLVPYVYDPIVNIVIMLLITIGGIGFIVWDDVSVNKFKFKKYSLHTKVVLLTSAILTFGGAILFFVTEYNNTMKDMNLYQRIITSLFSSVTARTAGFNTIDTAALSDSSKILTMALMFIGGSPGSTAGGIKTTTLFVLLVSVWGNMTNNGNVSVFKRRFENEALHKSGIVAVLNMVLAVVAAFVILTITNLPISDVLFEVFSAIGTVGMTTGITRSLNIGSRVIIMILMFCGRVGSLSFALSFLKKKNKAPLYDPQEKISIG